MWPDNIAFYDGSLHFADKIRPDSRIGIVGLGPGGLDSARYCIEHLHPRLPIDLFSRHGRLSKVQTKNPPAATHDLEVEDIVRGFEKARPIALKKVYVTFESLFKKANPEFNYAKITRRSDNALDMLQQDIRDAYQDGPSYRHILESIGSRASRIWRCLATSEKETFRTQYLRLYYVFRHAMPIQTAEWLVDHMQAGKIRIGCLLNSIEVCPDGMMAKIRFLPGPTGKVTYEHLVLATGPDWDLRKSSRKLIQQLIKDGIAIPDPLGGFSTDNFELSSSSNIFAMGANVRGEDFAVHSLPALTRHAKAIEAHIRHRLNSRRRSPRISQNTQ